MAERRVRAPGRGAVARPGPARRRHVARLLGPHVPREQRHVRADQLPPDARHVPDRARHAWSRSGGSRAGPLRGDRDAFAREAAGVTAIEENPHAVQLGRLNARINSARVDYLPGKVEMMLRKVRLGQYQAALLDPPRAGCEPAAIGELIRLGLDRLVYVSCEPSTHARDLIALVRGGYRVRRAAIVDMFPQTYHIETVALLERGSA